MLASQKNTESCRNLIEGVLLNVFFYERVHPFLTYQTGVTTEEIDYLVHSFIVEHGAYPSPLHYRGFPKSICTSINNVVCHG